MNTTHAPEGYNTINPFIITPDALSLIDFLKEVFAGVESDYAHTVDDDGLLLHAEVTIGDSVVMLAERKPDWPVTPALLQVYVPDLEQALADAQRLGARLVTKPTPFFDTTLSRIVDPSGNMWWVYQLPEPSTEEVDWSADGEEPEWTSGASAELIYIHDALLEGMRSLAR